MTYMIEILGSSSATSIAVPRLSIMIVVSIVVIVVLVMMIGSIVVAVVTAVAVADCSRI